MVDGDPDNLAVCEWPSPGNALFLRSSEKVNLIRSMSQPPRRYRQFIADHPEVGAAYEQLGEAARAAGPLTPREAALVKLAIAVGMQQEGAVHAHARRAIDAGCKAEDLEHAVLLAVTTLGFPRMMAAYSWVEDVVQGDHAT